MQMLSEVLGRVMRRLRGPQRHLRLQEGGAISLRGRVIQRGHVRLICERPPVSVTQQSDPGIRARPDCCMSGPAHTPTQPNTNPCPVSPYPCSSETSPVASECALDPSQQAACAEPVASLEPSSDSQGPLTASGAHPSEPVAYAVPFASLDPSSDRGLVVEYAGLPRSRSASRCCRSQASCLGSG